MAVENEDPAISAFPSEIEYLPAFSTGNLPTGPFSVLIGCAAGVNSRGRSLSKNPPCYSRLFDPEGQSINDYILIFDCV
jgi:hypothetical protein